MESLNQVHLINFLNDCNINLNTFKDLSFDGICQEKSLQHFLSWICSSFNRDNIGEFSNSQDIDGCIDCLPHDNLESIGESYDDLFDDVVESLSIKLKESGALKIKFVELDDKLRLKEKCLYEEISNAEKDLAAAVAECKSRQLEDEIEMMYKLILNTNPYNPNIELYNQKSENLRENIHDLYKSSVYVVEDKFKEEHNLFEPPVPDFEEMAFKIQLQNSISFRQMTATKQWLDNLKTPVDFQYLLSHSEWITPENKISSNEMNKIICSASGVAKGIALERETTINKRKHSINLYLSTQLIENNKLLNNCLTYSLFAQSFINARSNRIEKLSTLVDDFFGSIYKKRESINSIVNACTPNTCFVEAPIVRSISTVNAEVIDIYQELLQSLKNEYKKNQAFRENVGKSLQYFRNGPTLRFGFLPMDLIVQFDNCRNLHEKVVKDVRQNAGYYCNVKSTVRGDHDRTQQLMWVFFLTDPSKLASIQLEYSSFNITFRN